VGEQNTQTPAAPEAEHNRAQLQDQQFFTLNNAACAESMRAAGAGWMSAAAVNIRRMFDGGALRAAVVAVFIRGTRARGMSALLFLVGHEAPRAAIVDLQVRAVNRNRCSGRGLCYRAHTRDAAPP
jgi:hypothetical protein